MGPPTIEQRVLRLEKQVETQQREQAELKKIVVRMDVDLTRALNALTSQGLQLDKNTMLLLRQGEAIEGILASTRRTQELLEMMAGNTVVVRKTPDAG